MNAQEGAASRDKGTGTVFTGAAPSPLPPAATYGHHTPVAPCTPGDLCLLPMRAAPVLLTAAGTSMGTSRAEPGAAAQGTADHGQQPWRHNPTRAHRAPPAPAWHLGHVAAARSQALAASGVVSPVAAKRRVGQAGGAGSGSTAPVPPPQPGTCPPVPIRQDAVSRSWSSAGKPNVPSPPQKRGVTLG